MLVVLMKGIQYPTRYSLLERYVQSIPKRVGDLHQLIDGMEDDLYPTNYRSFEDLRDTATKLHQQWFGLHEIYGYDNPDARHAEEMAFSSNGKYLRDIQKTWVVGSVPAER